MSDVMLFGVLSMPLELIAADGLAIRQFHAKAQEAVARIQADTTRIEQLESALKIIASGHGFPSDVAENALAPVSIN